MTLQKPTTHDLDPSLDDVYAAIGKLLVQWGFLEGIIEAEGIDWRRTSPENPSFFDAEFRMLLAEPRATRNALSHGIVSAQANPWSSEEPSVTCRTSAGGKRIFSLSDLVRTQNDIEALRIRLIRRQKTG